MQMLGRFESNRLIHLVQFTTFQKEVKNKLSKRRVTIILHHMTKFHEISTELYKNYQ